MKFKYLTILIALLCFFNINDTFSQETKTTKSAYRITSNTSKFDNNYVLESLEKANMENYRLRNENVEISFKEGITCVLVSATELSKTDNTVDISNYKERFANEYSIPTFRIGANGSLLAEYSKKKLK